MASEHEPNEHHQELFRKADPAVYSRNQTMTLPGQSRLRSACNRVQAIITSSPEKHLLTACFNGDCEAMQLSAPMSSSVGLPEPTRSTRGSGGGGQLAPWPEACPSDAWAMTSDPIETLRMIRHRPDPPHRSPHTGDLMLWFRHRRGAWRISWNGHSAGRRRTRWIGGADGIREDYSDPEGAGHGPSVLCAHP